MSLITSLRQDGSVPVIQQGDLVIVYERFDVMKAVVVTEDGMYQNRFGAFPHRVGWKYMDFSNACIQNHGHSFTVIGGG